MDELIAFGGSVKALGDGRVQGYLVLFGSPDQTDVSAHRDFFTPETDFDLREGAKTALWYRHGLDSALDRKIGEGALKVDDVGVWIDGQLDLRDRYTKAVYDQMATKGALGWSSGTALHLIRREKQDNGSHKIVRWPLGLDASLTPDPAEPRTQAVTAIKSLAELPDVKPLAELVEAGETQGAVPPADSAFKSERGDFARREATLAAVRAYNDALFYSAVYECVYQWDKGLNAPLSERLETLRAAFDEFRDLTLEAIRAILSGAEGAETADGAMKALRTLWGPDVPEPLSEHAAKVVAANAAFAERLDSRLEARTRAGRALSRANQEALKSVADSVAELDAVKTRLEGLLGEERPAEQSSAPGDLESRRQQLLLQVRGTAARCGLSL